MQLIYQNNQILTVNHYPRGVSGIDSAKDDSPTFFGDVLSHLAFKHTGTNMKFTKMKPAAVAVAAAVSSVFISAAAYAAPQTLTGNYVKVVVQDAGVFSSLIFDPSGTGTFNPNNDYISPGTPFEGFGVRIGTGGLIQNVNGSTVNIAGTTAVGTGADNAALWTGATAQFSLQHLFKFNDNDQRVNITTTFTALQSLTNVRISRAADPDPDSLSHGTASTNNQRGIPTNTPPVPTQDFVGSVGSVSGLPLGLFFSGPLAHNTGLANSCCSVTDPDFYLAGGDLGNASVGDDGIGIAFNLGNFTAGQSFSWTYAYVMGGSLGTIDIPPPPPPPGGSVPEPGSLALLGLAALAAVGARRRKS